TSCTCGGRDGGQGRKCCGGAHTDPHVLVAQATHRLCDPPRSGNVAVDGDLDPLGAQLRDPGLDLPRAGLGLADVEVDLRRRFLCLELLDPRIDLVELRDRAVDVGVDLDGAVRQGLLHVLAEPRRVPTSPLLLEQYLDVRGADLEALRGHQRAFRRTSNMSGWAVAIAARGLVSAPDRDERAKVAAWWGDGDRGRSASACSRS